MKSVFGEPLQVAGAAKRRSCWWRRSRYGFGAGGGSHPNGEHNGDGNGKTEGGGGGGGVAGFFRQELWRSRRTGHRFITYPDWRLAAAIFSAGVAFGAMRPGGAESSALHLIARIMLACHHRVHGGYLNVARNWQAVRVLEFPALSNWTYLNSATFGQLPRRAVEARGASF